MADIAQLAERLSVEQEVAGSIPAVRPLYVCICSSMAEHTVDNRVVTGSSPVGCMHLWGVGVVGEHAGFSTRRWRVRISHALLKVWGRGPDGVAATLSMLRSRVQVPPSS